MVRHWLEDFDHVKRDAYAPSEERSDRSEVEKEFPYGYRNSKLSLKEKKEWFEAKFINHQTRVVRTINVQPVEESAENVVEDNSEEEQVSQIQVSEDGEKLVATDQITVLNDQMFTD